MRRPCSGAGSNRATQATGNERYAHRRGRRQQDDNDPLRARAAGDHRARRGQAAPGRQQARKTEAARTRLALGPIPEETAIHPAGASADIDTERHDPARPHARLSTPHPQLTEADDIARCAAGHPGTEGGQPRSQLLPVPDWLPLG
ncbi:hypothetical protein JCM4814A_94800 [Streptomyces phaeofaciens JCM 4814]|uniref:Uncharacterized protein n=1 Tax=Streptomyces phaeofaciens TaxID=68254 RepID=A0A918HS23_9ACTN|nr:hypothetical protein GCM10010226_88540 [Streptomyces phaeofaciens]